VRGLIARCRVRYYVKKTWISVGKDREAAVVALLAA
jgi:hypothetical protein